MKKILLVEDNEQCITIVSKFLSTRYNLKTVKNSKEALSSIENDKEEFDLILMDILLQQGDNGLSLTKKIRSDNRYSYTPIIAVTAYEDIQHNNRYKTYGFNSCIIKPFRKNELMEKIEDYI